MKFAFFTNIISPHQMPLAQALVALLVAVLMKIGVCVGAECRIMSTVNTPIVIGNHCNLGTEVMILTGSYEIDVDRDHVGDKETAASVNIGDGCWLWRISTILPNVSIAKKNILAFGSVMTVSGFEEKCL